MRAHTTRIGHNIVMLLLCSLLIWALVPSALADTVIPVSSHADIVNAISSHAGEAFTLELQKSFMLGDTTAIAIPLGTNVTLTNKAGISVVIARHPFKSLTNSRIDILGSLTIVENSSGGGSLTFSSSVNLYCAGDPQFAVSGDGSRLTIESGTISNQCSGYGAIYSADGATTTINGGLFTGNYTPYDKFNHGTGQGGVIWAANCNLTINGGEFDGNTSDLIGGAIYYDGRTRDQKLIVNGGTFTNNVANGAFGGGAIFIDCVDLSGMYSLAEINAGVFDGNSAPGGAGGALYIQKNAEAKIGNSSIWSNSSSGNGGGIWNCATGGGVYYSFHGMYLAGNRSADKGDDFYSVPKQVQAAVYLTDYTYTGEKFNWAYDDGSFLQGTLAPSSYYQESSDEIALVSGLPNTEDLNAKVFFRNNNGLTGGAIANNGALQMGETSMLTIQKQTTVPTNEAFHFQVVLTSHNGQAMSGGFLYSDNAAATNGRITFDANGIGQLTLKAGQQITILDLPVGTRYLVKETALPAGWQLISPNNISGSVSSTSQAAPVSSIAFVNEFGVTPPVPLTGDDRPISLMLTLAALSFAGMLALLFADRHNRKRCK